MRVEQQFIDNMRAWRGVGNSLNRRNEIPENRW